MSHDFKLKDQRDINAWRLGWFEAHSRIWARDIEEIRQLECLESATFNIVRERLAVLAQHMQTAEIESQASADKHRDTG